MKKTWKLILSLLCIAALVCSLGVGAFAYTDEEIDAKFAELERANDALEIQNVMSWHVMYHCYGEHRAEMENLWVQEPENQATASFGQNQGFMAGYGSIWDGYVTGHDTSWLRSAKNYCNKNGIDVSGWTDEQILEVYGGVGQLLLHVTTTSIIQVADDGKTAKAFWYSPGMIMESGQSAGSIWEAYGADFVKEEGGWKMWHLHMFTDFGGSFFVSLGSNSSGEPTVVDNSQSEWKGEEGSQLYLSGAIEADPTIDGSTRHDYLNSQQYTQFSTHRLRSEMEIFLPTAYESWSFEDGNYGPTADEWRALGVDLDAWYAAHDSAAPAAKEVTWKDYQDWLISILPEVCPFPDAVGEIILATNSWDEIDMASGPWGKIFGEDAFACTDWATFSTNGGVGSYNADFVDLPAEDAP